MDSIFRMGWMQRGAHDEMERERQAVLSKPPAPNPPELLAPVKVRVLKPFGLGADRIAQLGEIVELPRHDAQSLAAIGRVELLA